MRQRTQHLAEGLARTRPVIFVEPAAYSLPGAIRHRLARQRTGPLVRRLRKCGDNVLVYSPLPSLPGSLSLRRLNALVHALAWQDLRRVIPTIATTRSEVVVAWPPAFDLARRLPARRLIYDCLDLFPAFDGGGRQGQLLASLEEELVRAAFAVVVPSRDLERRLSARHPRVRRIPNGVELTRFDSTAPPPVVPADLAALPRPRLGYVGTVGRWVDLELLAHVARHRPDCGVAVIGPVESDVAPPHGPANLRLLGERPYATVPAYLAGLDVLLIPFRLMDLTHAVNPVKLYEYCATGKPIVSTPIEDIVAEPGLCHVGDGHDAFLEAIDDALLEAASPDTARTAARQAFARASSWDRRVSAFASLLDEHGGDPL